MFIKIYQDTLCLLTGEFHPFTCKMITDREGITTAIWLTVFCLFCRFSCLIALVMVIVLFLSCCLLCFIFFLLWHALIPFSFSLVHLLYFLYSYHVHYIKHLIFINVYFKLTKRSFQLHKEILLFSASSLTHSYFMLSGSYIVFELIFPCREESLALPILPSWWCYSSNKFYISDKWHLFSWIK